VPLAPRVLRVSTMKVLKPFDYPQALGSGRRCVPQSAPRVRCTAEPSRRPWQARGCRPTQCAALAVGVVPIGPDLGELAQ
jgi:hypothetical protein